MLHCFVLLRRQKGAKFSHEEKFGKKIPNFPEKTWFAGTFEKFSLRKLWYRNTFFRKLSKNQSFPPTQIVGLTPLGNRPLGNEKRFLQVQRFKFCIFNNYANCVADSQIHIKLYYKRICESVHRCDFHIT